MKKLILLINSLTLSACSMVGIRQSEEPDYRLLLDEAPFQVRVYPPLLVAETCVTGDYQIAGNQAFRRLAGFIFGDNAKQASIAMTTPVFRQTDDDQSEQIAMTVPVFQQSQDTCWRMSFVMPREYQADTLPLPLDQAIEIHTLPARKVATLRYSGSLNLDNIESHSQQLSSWIRTHGFKIISAPRSAAYDPPWTIPALRRNEIHIDIE